MKTISEQKATEIKDFLNKLDITECDKDLLFKGIKDFLIYEKEKPKPVKRYFIVILEVVLKNGNIQKHELRATTDNYYPKTTEIKNWVLNKLNSDKFIVISIIELSEQDYNDYIS